MPPKPKITEKTDIVPFFSDVYGLIFRYNESGYET